MEELSRKSFDPNQNEFWQGYHFDYDAWGNTEEIKVWKPTSGTAATPTGDTTTLATYQYNCNGTLARMNYPSGQYVTYEYDLLDRLVKEVYYNSGDSIQVEYQYIYSSDGQLAKQQAIRNGTVVESYRFEYDSLGRLIRSREGGDNNSVQRTEHLYDGANRLTAQNWTVGERSFTEAYAYDAADGTMSAMLATYDDGSGWFARDMLTYTYDDLNRLTQVLDTENYSTQFYTRNYTYQDLSGDRTTSRLAQYVYRKPSDSSIICGNSYAYDANGNITQINEVYTVNGADASRTLVVYTYDDLNQLTQETRYTYAGTSTTPAATTTVNYTIDTAGNLRSVTGGEHSVSYTYADTAWADRLTGITVDNVSRTINYASAGNPSNWFNGADYTGLTWTQGRRLSSVTKGSDTYTYEYDMSGVRSVKVANGLRHEYVTQNGRVVRDKVTNDSTGAFQYMLDFIYDESGHPFLMRRYYNEAQTNYNTYHYVLNAQGDVVKLVHSANITVKAEYTYDAWGNVLTATGDLADVNPLRYRGYYYDTETGFYYLQSRYYDPIVKRFLNADSYASTGQGFIGHNMFAYCGNEPNHFIDVSGDYPVWQELFEDGDYGFIHRAVQSHILLKNPGVNMEGCLFNENGDYCGRVDLYENDGSIWEVKTTKSGIVAAETRLARYLKDGNTIGLNGPATHIGVGGMFPGRFAGSFPLECGEDAYIVVYYTPQPGIVLYYVQKSKRLDSEPYAVYVPKRERSPSKQPRIGYAVAAAGIGIGIMGTIAFCGSGGGYSSSRFSVCVY